MKRFAACTLAAITLAAACFFFLRGNHRGSPGNSSKPQPAPWDSPPAVMSPVANAGQPPASPLPPSVPSLSASNSSGKVSPPSGPRKRAWDPQFLAGLRDVNEGDPLRFELVDGEWALGTIQFLERKNGELIRVSGRLTGPEPGRFFFQKQTQPGVAGNFVGVVEFPRSKRAYRIEPTGQGGSP